MKVRKIKRKIVLRERNLWVWFMGFKVTAKSLRGW